MLLQALFHFGVCLFFSFYVIVFVSDFLDLLQQKLDKYVLKKIVLVCYYVRRYSENEVP